MLLLLMATVAVQAKIESDGLVNVQDGKIYPIQYPIVVGRSDVQVFLNGVKQDHLPIYLDQPGICTLEIVHSDGKVDVASFEVADYIPLTAVGSLFTSNILPNESVRVGVILQHFELDRRSAIEHVLPQILVPCESDTTVVTLTLFSATTASAYHTKDIYVSEKSLLAYFEIPKSEMNSDLFVVGTLNFNGQRFIFETEFLSMEDVDSVDLSSYTYTYCPPGDGGCTPRCSWRKKVITHEKNKLFCSVGFPLHFAEVHGVSAGNTMWGKGRAIDTIPLFGIGCSDAKSGLYRVFVYHYNENPRCPCIGQTISANMRPTFVACASRKGFSIFYWMSYAQAGGRLSVSATGLGEAMAEGGVHSGGSASMTIGNSPSITLSPAPSNRCLSFSDNKSHGPKDLSSTLVTCSSDIGIDVYAEGGMGGALTLYAEAEAEIRDASCNTELVLSCPCCGMRTLKIR